MLWGILLALPALLIVSSGEPVQNGKVVTNFRRYSYVVHLLITFEHVKTKKLIHAGCGGVILKPEIILTAAHCLYDKKNIVREIRVTAGSVYRDDEKDKNAKTRSGAGFRIHKNFAPEKLKFLSGKIYLPFDIAMLWLDQPFILRKNSNVQAAKMLLADIPPNTIGTVVGWGQDEHGNPSDVLKQASLRKLSDEDCKKYDTHIGPHAFCAISVDGRCGISPGDSGGPFIIEDSVVGIASFGAVYDEEIEPGESRRFCNQRKPVVFGDLRMYREWIGISLNKGAPSLKCKKAQQKSCAL